MSDRKCGGCTMCCKLMGIVELKKPANVWCTHCAIGTGCTIYGEHPPSCQDFACLWLQGVGPDHMRPDKSKVVMFLPEATDNVLAVSVDSATPDAWQRGPVSQVIQQWLTSAKNVMVLMCGNRAEVHGKDPVAVADMKRRAVMYTP